MRPNSYIMFCPTNVKKDRKIPTTLKKKNPKNLDTYNVNKSLFPYLLQFVSRFSSIYI